MYRKFGSISSFYLCYLLLSQLRAHQYTRTTTQLTSTTTRNETVVVIQQAGQCGAFRNYPRGTEIRIKCPHGYELLGSPDTTCDANDKWNGGALPVCRKIIKYPGCAAPPSPANGYIINHGGLLSNRSSIVGIAAKDEVRFEVGGWIRYSCVFCYLLKGFGTIKCKQDGTWSDTVPSCEKGYYFIDNRIARC